MINNNTLVIYAKSNYKKMLREPNGNLKYKYIVPGSVYSDELWDWDSWLVDIALRQFVKEDISEYARGCVLNFLAHCDENGRIPIVIRPHSVGPDLSNPHTNIHKPCLAQHAAFIVKNDGDVEWIREEFHKILRYVDCYMTNFRHQCGLYFWFNDVAIGVDNDPCTYFRPEKSSGSIFLNCMMYKELEAVCYIGNLLGVNIEKYEKEKEHLKRCVQENCYDKRDGFFYSVDLNLLPIDKESEIHAGAPRSWECLIQRIGSWSGLLSLWSGIATEEQAKRVVHTLLADDAFWAPCGIRTLANYEKMYAIEATGNPSCWLGPVWGVSNYLVFRGLVQYGYLDAAKELAEKTVAMFESDIAKTSVLHEYYHPDDGIPIMNPGFQNWNLLAINMLAWLNGDFVVQEF